MDRPQSNRKRFFVLLNKVFRVVLLILALVFTAGQVYFNSQPFSQALSNFNQATNTKPSDFITHPTFYNDTLNNIYVGAFQPLFILAAISAFIGTLILGQARSIWELLGLFIGFVIPRQRKNWGIIFDKDKRKPIPFAVIRLFSQTDTPHSHETKEMLITQTVSDLDGRYRIHLEEKLTYRLVVEAPGFNKFEKTLDTEYQVLIQQELVEDVYLLREAPKGGNLLQEFNYLRPQLAVYLMYFFYLMSFILFVHSTYGILIYPELDTVLFMGIYTFSFAWNTVIIRDRRRQKIGRILEQGSNQPLANTFISIFQQDKAVGTSVSETSGGVQLQLEPGMYLLKVTKPGFEMPVDKNTMANGYRWVRVNDKGYLTEDIHLRKLSELSDSARAKLMNPFGN